jgi:hypothetical protein
MKAHKKGELAWKERNKGTLVNLGIAENKSELSKLRTISIVPVGGTTQWERDSDSTAQMARACATSLLRRVQMLQ